MNVKGAMRDGLIFFLGVVTGVLMSWSLMGL
jgi:hypothetical protein